MDTLHPKLKLSALWLFILLNVVFRDIHQFTMKSHLEMLLTGYYNGMEVTEILMLVGGIVLEIPIAMVLFSLLLKRKINRPVNLVAVIITAGLFLVEPPSDLDDWFFKIVEFIGFIAILWTARSWKADEDSPILLPR
ncbi:MAG: hypothetical protein KTR30_14840 [Saprospiraceae bacterium]|nr:hypothetical protein [Saprospiraceae bacterium]